MNNRTAIVIGAGIIGLATARALALKGFSVTVFERNYPAVGASIRNFGLVFPMAQPAGELYERAMKSRSVWEELSDAGACWSEAAGSLQLAYQPLEWQVLQEIHALYGKERNLQLLTARQVLERSPAVVEKNLLGALYSPDELVVDPRQAIASIPGYLESTLDIRFQWGRPVQSVSSHAVHSMGEMFRADLIFICSGSDFETLYPAEMAALPITKCKLQMMRTVPQPGNWRIGPVLCGGLSLVHYKSFEPASSVIELRRLYQETMKPYIDWGINVLVTQNEAGEITLGDSHEYGTTFDPFDKSFINELILGYLKNMVHLKDPRVSQTWNGIYAKMTNGVTEIFFSPEPGVYILNGPGGTGMTLGWGLAETMIDSIS